MSSASPAKSPPLPPTDNTALTVPPSTVTTTPPSPRTFSGSPPPPGQSNSTALTALGVGIGFGGTIVLVIVGFFVIWYRRRKRRFGKAGLFPSQPKGDINGLPQHWQQITRPSGIASDLQLSSMGTSAPALPYSVRSNLGSEKLLSHSSTTSIDCGSKNIFTYEELGFATSGFSEANLLGQGGFGYVHKGVLPNGQEVAIKQLKLGSCQGEREFQAEVEMINRVHHRHLVSLVGYCTSGPQRMLVYEYVPNNTLEFHLHEKDNIPINWDTRMKVALGSARGLAYLHEECQPKIIHRDIKASNILLDGSFEAKVADFGLARFYSDTDTHVSTRVMGTFGYLAPEYALTGKLTEKSDVFSFGVMLLELITGRRPIDKGQFLDDNIVDWARPLLTPALEDGNFDTLADLRLQNDYDATEMKRMVACASVCVRHLARCRPRMSQVVRALEGNMSLEDLKEGIRTGHSRTYGSHDSLDYDTLQYKEDLNKFRKMALQGQDNNSSGHSGLTSDFGPHPSASSSEGLRISQDMGMIIEGQHRPCTQKDRVGESLDGS